MKAPKWSIKNAIGFILGPLAFIGIAFFTDLKPGEPAVTYTLAIALLMAIRFRAASSLMPFSVKLTRFFFQLWGKSIFTPVSRSMALRIFPHEASWAFRYNRPFLIRNVNLLPRNSDAPAVVMRTITDKVVKSRILVFFIRHTSIYHR